MDRLINVIRKNAGARKRRLTGLAAKLAHAVVVNSRATRDVLLEAGVPGHKIHVIPPGVERPRRELTRDAARSRLGVPADAFVVASLGRLVREKGVADLIDALALAPDGDDLLLIVAGDADSVRIWVTLV